MQKKLFHSCTPKLNPTGPRAEIMLNFSTNVFAFLILVTFPYHWPKLPKIMNARKLTLT